MPVALLVREFLLGMVAIGSHKLRGISRHACRGTWLEPWPRRRVGTEERRPLAQEIVLGFGVVVQPALFQTRFLHFMGGIFGMFFGVDPGEEVFNIGHGYDFFFYLSGQMT
eukprot:s3156_g3.t1